MNYKIGLKYNGANYKGWAIQPNVVTIQGTIKEAFKSLFNLTVNINASGRTDARVHALDQVINVSHKELNISSDVLKEALNSRLPKDIRVKYVERINQKFHARYSCVSKTYIYLINTKPDYDIIHFNNVFQYNKELDIEKINKIRHMFIGEKDFLSFSTTTVENTVRKINWINITEEDGIVKISVNGNGFLRNMVRMIVGSFLAYNEDKITQENIIELFKNPQKGKSQFKAYACGLYLAKVFYEEEN
ncbi:MAG: tRNA pseudouridine(38-40) synthase TruA [Mycoplasma sp.]